MRGRFVSRDWPSKQTCMRKKKCGREMITGSNLGVGETAECLHIPQTNAKPFRGSRSGVACQPNFRAAESQMGREFSAVVSAYLRGLCKLSKSGSTPVAIPEAVRSMTRRIGASLRLPLDTGSSSIVHRCHPILKYSRKFRFASRIALG